MVLIYQLRVYHCQKEKILIIDKIIDKCMVKMVLGVDAPNPSMDDENDSHLNP
jgi:hypothetical protein